MSFVSSIVSRIMFAMLCVVFATHCVVSIAEQMHVLLHFIYKHIIIEYRERRCAQSSGTCTLKNALKKDVSDVLHSASVIIPTSITAFQNMVYNHWWYFFWNVLLFIATVTVAYQTAKYCFKKMLQGLSFYFNYKHNFHGHNLQGHLFYLFCAIFAVFYVCHCMYPLLNQLFYIYTQNETSRMWRFFLEEYREVRGCGFKHPMHCGFKHDFNSRIANKLESMQIIFSQMLKQYKIIILDAMHMTKFHKLDWIHGNYY
jgi:hypothetical protein